MNPDCLAHPAKIRTVIGDIEARRRTHPTAIGGRWRARRSTAKLFRDLSASSASGFSGLRLQERPPAQGLPPSASELGRRGLLRASSSGGFSLGAATSSTSGSTAARRRLLQRPFEGAQTRRARSASEVTVFFPHQFDHGHPGAFGRPLRRLDFDDAGCRPPLRSAKNGAPISANKACTTSLSRIF